MTNKFMLSVFVWIVSSQELDFEAQAPLRYFVHFENNLDGPKSS